MTTDHQRINQDSGDQEYYTPMKIVEAARRAMGGIDLDPFTSELANERIKATSIFTKETNGLTNPWFGRVWCNHPFGRSMNKAFIEKIGIEFTMGRMKQGCCITFAATSEQWFQPLMGHPQCFLRPRTNYYCPDGTLKRGVTKGSVVTYFGPNVEAFAREFRDSGTIKVAYHA